MQKEILFNSVLHLLISQVFTFVTRFEDVFQNHYPEFDAERVSNTADSSIFCGPANVTNHLKDVFEQSAITECCMVLDTCVGYDYILPNSVKHGLENRSGFFVLIAYATLLSLLRCNDSAVNVEDVGTFFVGYVVGTKFCGPGNTYPDMMEIMDITSAKIGVVNSTIGDNFLSHRENLLDFFTTNMATQSHHASAIMN
ncbi:hypothetical protein HA402_002630 [Bradysia odoriphaga]|nr:hypothetical protein HA402_002630 [Bradysia odoriphaga]